MSVAGAGTGTWNGRADPMAYKDTFTVLVVDSRIERSQSLRHFEAYIEQVKTPF